MASMTIEFRGGPLHRITLEVPAHELDSPRIVATPGIRGGERAVWKYVHAAGVPGTIRPFVLTPRDQSRWYGLLTPEVREHIAAVMRANIRPARPLA